LEKNLINKKKCPLYKINCIKINSVVCNTKVLHPSIVISKQIQHHAINTMYRDEIIIKKQIHNKLLVSGLEASVDLP